MPEVFLAIQTHPRRAELAAWLLDRLGGAAELVLDPEPDGRPSPWRTYRRALERGIESGRSHVLVVQDDVVPCDRLPEAVGRAVEAQPDRILLFFVAGRPAEYRRAVLEACRYDRTWAEIRPDVWVPAVATCWPAELAAELLDWSAAMMETRWPPTFTADDEIIGRFVRHLGVAPLASVPSLVEHPDLVPSLAGKRVHDGRDPGRKAACWIGECDDCDPLGIDWTLPPFS